MYKIFRRCSSFAKIDCRCGFSSKKTLSDYRKVFNLRPNYTEQQLKNTYLELVKKYHPDLNKDPEAVMKFQQIQEAYDILSDPTKFKEYEQKPKQEKKSERKTKKTSEQQHSDFMDQFEERLARRYEKKQKRDEGMKFSYNLYKKHYEQVQEKKKQYQRYYGGDKQYFAKPKQKPDNILKNFGMSVLMIGIVSGSIWFVNKK